MLKKKLIDNEKETTVEVEGLPIEIQNGGTYVIKQPNPNSYTHGYFKYPCKFIPEIPRWAINKFTHNYKAKILDPFSGSGTTLLESILTGHDAYGTEIDSFAKLLIKVKTTPLTVEEMNDIEVWIKKLIGRYKDSYMRYSTPYVPAIRNLDHWFSFENIQKLGLIKSEIEFITNERIANFLNVCLASSVRKCSNADDVSPKPYVSNKVKKNASDPFVYFPNIVRKYLSSMSEFSLLTDNHSVGTCRVLEGDALDININSELKFDIAITSPPYINAFDYGRTLRLENLWLGLESEETIKNKKREYVGTENVVTKIEEADLEILELSNKLKEVFHKIEPIDKKRALIVKRFFEDMKQNLEEVSRVLKENGRYCIVIGDSTIRGIHVESWSIISDIADILGYQLENHFSYVIQNHYLRIPRGNQGGKISKDYVFVLKKTT